MDTDEIAHWRELINVYKKRLRVLELQAASHGRDCPPNIQTEIEDLEEKIGTLEQKIQHAIEQHGELTNQDDKKQGPAVTSKASDSKRLEQESGRIDCPYPGMVPFRAEDARFFYGRDAEIQQMLQHLRHHRYLFVIGPSGSGKSSLVEAGLLPKLQQSTYFSQGFWLVRSMRPGSQPVQALAQAIESELDQPAEALAELLTAHPPAQRLLLVIDQFEELFTQAERAEQSRFIAALKTLRTLKSCVLLIAMRADFYPDLMTSDLWPVAPSQRLEIAPLRGEALRQAIQQPATDVGVHLETGLLERLLADAAEEPGVLPLVQETMVLLWGKMAHYQLLLSAYKELGSEGRSGLAVAVTTKADATLDELSPIQQAIARRIFLRLVQFGEGRADTRRQQPVAALRSANDDPILFELTLQHLTDNRLLTLGGEKCGTDRSVDLAHEALITGWPTLQGWLAERREAEQTRRRLEAKAAEWVRMGRGHGALLDSAELPEAEHWLSSADAAYLGFDETLTELVKASRTVIEESEREKAARALTEPMIMLDVHQRVVLFSLAAEELLGIPESFVLHQPLAHLKEYDATGTLPRRAELIYEGMRGGLIALGKQVKSHSFVLDLPSPPQSIALNFAAVVGPNGIHYGSAVVMRDVTREIEASRAQRDFISSISHELRTPLTSIKGYVDLLLLGAAGPIPDSQLSFLAVIKNNANRQMDLINYILEIGRIDADKIKLNFEQVDVAHVFQDVLQTLRAEIERKAITVSVDVQEALPQVTADPRRLTQVVMNMVSNAVKYTYPEGQVALRAFLNPVGMLQVDVEDNGVGISPEQQQHLFRRFYRANNPLRDEAGGTGLGLSIAKSFIELHGGEMWVKSEVGKGSTFSFILPVTQSEQPEQS